MSEIDILQAVSQVGFPIAVSAFLLWKGYTQDKEFLMLVKTTRELLQEIKHAVAKIHSYHTPEIICLPIIDGSRNYLQWVSDSVKQL